MNRAAITAIRPALEAIAAEHPGTPMGNGSASASLAYEITWSDHKPPRLVLPDVPALDDTAGLCAWLTCAFNLHAAHPITSGRHEGLRGPDGHAVLERRGAAPLRFEPQSKINTPARLIEVLSWQTGPTDGAIHALKGDHCRQIAHVVRMLCGATKAISDEEETADLVSVFLAEAIVQEGHTLYGTTAQRYEAATALQRELDEHTGRPRGVARYLIDANTGEYVIRVQDLGESVRRQLGSGLTRVPRRPHGRAQLDEGRSRRVRAARTRRPQGAARALQRLPRPARRHRRPGIGEHVNTVKYYVYARAGRATPTHVRCGVHRCSVVGQFESRSAAISRNVQT